MSNNNDTLETPAPVAAPEPPDAEGDDGADDEGSEESEATSGTTAAPGPGGAPGQGPGPTPGPRRRRRRRRGRGAPVLFTPEGQAYRMLTGPDGQQNQVFLTPQELQQWQARQQQQQQPQGGQQAPGGAPRQQQPQVQANLAAVEGVLDTEAKGPNAFLRQIRRNLLPGPEDAEIPKNLVQKLRLRQGQYLTAMAQMRGQKGLVQRVETVDDRPVEGAPKLPHFNDLTSIDPVERIKLEHGHREMVTRVLDLIAPLGKGQRALIVSPPKAGKTIMLQRIAQAVLANHPEVQVMVLLLDERPEEVTDFRRSIAARGEVLASSSDRPTGDHLKVAEMALERARRMVEAGKDVVILLDSITRLARAFNKEV